MYSVVMDRNRSCMLCPYCWSDPLGIKRSTVPRGANLLLQPVQQQRIASCLFNSCRQSTFFHRTPVLFSFQMWKLRTNFPYQSSDHWYLMGTELMAASAVNKQLLFSSNICMSSRFYDAVLWAILLSSWVKQLTSYRQAGNACIMIVHYTSNWSAIILEEYSTLLEGNIYFIIHVL